MPNLVTLPHLPLYVHAHSFDPGAAAKGLTEMHGNSLIVDPWSKVVARCPGEGDGLATADMTLEAIAETRARIPLKSDARPVSEIMH